MWKIVLLTTAISLQILAFPADDDVRPGQTNYGLKFTFDNKDDVPSSFFNTPVPVKASISNAPTVVTSSTTTTSTTTTTAAPPPPPPPPSPQPSPPSAALASTVPAANTSMILTTPEPSTATDPAPPQARRAYPACQDGSGGMCVDAGTCPSNLRPTNSSANACASGQECCFGPPTTDKTCGSRGGECRPTSECGGAPTFLEAEDCDQKNGQICCILI